MKWWKKALILSGIWVVLTIGAAIVHTNIMAGKITPEQDNKISEAYGKLCGGGLVAIWAMPYFIRKMKEQRDRLPSNPNERIG